MTIPTASNYPASFDSDNNLYLVHDALRGTLISDYTPGDTTISASGDILIMAKFPVTGIITLTEQCSEIDNRAISFYYSGYTLGTLTNSGERLIVFTGIEILPEFTAYTKPKQLTNVTLNVIAPHHNNLKDALIAIEEFMGVRGSIDLVPGGEIITGRIGLLLGIVFSPRSWFRISGPTLGLTPLDVTFHEQCFRLGPGDLSFVWDFGDGVSNISTQIISITDSTISVISVGEANIVSIFDYTNAYPSTDYLKKTIVKTYANAGVFSPSLTVSNQYGTNIVSFDDIINPRLEAPEEAVVDITSTNQQFFIRFGEPVGGPYSVTPILRSATNTVISMEIPDEIITGTVPLRTAAGELVDPDSHAKYDPIIEYIWSLGDDIEHSNLNYTKALYSIGGIYDLKVRTNTQFGAYRITTYENALDIVESQNLWLWNINSSEATANEFGLISETFKTMANTLTVSRDDSFLTGSNNQTQAEREFARNVAFSSKTLANSGDRGLALIYWAQGGTNPNASQNIKITEYEGFKETYTSATSLDRYWNWLCLSSLTTSYFLFGSEPTGSIPSDTNPSNQTKGVLDKSDLIYDDSYSFTLADYENGADELRQHVTSGYDGSGEPENGYFAVYRGCWKGTSGYFVRNDGVSPYFRIKSFYKTDGVVGNEFTTIKKLTDMEGPSKLEGQLVALTNGVFFFNNSGNISAYNTTSGVWETGVPSLSSLSFRSVQDTSVLGFDNLANTLLATSDEDRVAYLSYDYSPNAFIKFNGQDITFTVITSRPTGEQFTMGIY